MSDHADINAQIKSIFKLIVCMSLMIIVTVKNWIID